MISNNKNPFIAQLLLPLPKGERAEDRPFDADDWIMRLRAAGGKAHFSSPEHGKSFICQIDATEARQFAIISEIGGQPELKTEIDAALNARRDQDWIEIRLEFMRNSARNAKANPDNRMAQAVAAGIADTVVGNLRAKGVREDIIQAALAGEVA